MSERDIFFAVMSLILLSTLVVFVWQFMRSRRSRGDGEERGGAWWEGPWDDDRR